jgi:hypothetical protein
MSAKLIAPTLQLPSRTPEAFWRPSSKGATSIRSASPRVRRMKGAKPPNTAAPRSRSRTP